MKSYRNLVCLTITALCVAMLMTPSEAKMARKQVNMGIVDPYSAKLRKEFSKTD